VNAVARLFPLIGVGVAGLAAGTPARADLVQFGASATTTIAQGQISNVGEPSVGGDISARLLLGQHVSLGVVAGRQGQSVVYYNYDQAWNPRTRLSVSTVGASGRWAGGLASWAVRPFLGLDSGYARFSSDNADFNPYPLSNQTPGFFITPQIGLTANLGHRLALEMAWRYQYLRARGSLNVGDVQAHDLSGTGFSGGVSLTL
jgi:hypothetical protein